MSRQERTKENLSRRRTRLRLCSFVPAIIIVISIIVVIVFMLMLLLRAVFRRVDRCCLDEMLFEVTIKLIILLKGVLGIIQPLPQMVMIHSTRKVYDVRAKGIENNGRKAKHTAVQGVRGKYTEDFSEHLHRVVKDS